MSEMIGRENELNVLNSLNLQDFSKMVQMGLDGAYIASFEGWKDAFEYVDRKVDERTVLIIDEFPFIAEENPTIKSILQHASNLALERAVAFLIAFFELWFIDMLVYM